MKQLLTTIILSLALSVWGQVTYADNLPTSNKQPTNVKHVFGVHGLSCPFCVHGIKKTFKNIKGVQSVDVSLKRKTVTIYTAKDKCFSDDELDDIFSKAGFSYHGTISKPKSCSGTS